MTTCGLVLFCFEQLDRPPPPFRSRTAPVTKPSLNLMRGQISFKCRRKFGNCYLSFFFSDTDICTRNRLSKAHMNSLVQKNLDLSIVEDGRGGRTLHPAPCTLHPALHTLHPTPYTLHPTPCTLHPTPYTTHHCPALHASRQDSPHLGRLPGRLCRGIGKSR